jgi:hypothetical protein
MMKDAFAAGLWVFAKSVEKHGGYDSALSVRERCAWRLRSRIEGRWLIWPSACFLE